MKMMLNTKRDGTEAGMAATALPLWKLAGLLVVPAMLVSANGNAQQAAPITVPALHLTQPTSPAHYGPYNATFLRVGGD